MNLGLFAPRPFGISLSGTLVVTCASCGRRASVKTLVFDATPWPEDVLKVRWTIVPGEGHFCPACSTPTATP